MPITYFGTSTLRNHKYILPKYVCLGYLQMRNICKLRKTYIELNIYTRKNYKISLSAGYSQTATHSYFIKYKTVEKQWLAF